MVYHLHAFRLTVPQVKKLHKGTTVKIAHKDLVGPHRVHLTATQLKKVRTHRRLGKPVSIKLSKAQVKHSMRVGGSVFDFVKALAKPIIRKGIEYGAKYAGNKALDYGLGKVGLGMHHYPARSRAVHQRKRVVHRRPALATAKRLLLGQAGQAAPSFFDGTPLTRLVKHKGGAILPRRKPRLGRHRRGGSFSLA